LSSRAVSPRSTTLFYCLALSLLVILFVWFGYNTSRVFLSFSTHIEELEVALLSIEDCLSRFRECEIDLRLATRREDSSYLGSYAVRRSLIEPQLKNLKLSANSNIKELFEEQLKRQADISNLIKRGELIAAAETLKQGETRFEEISERAESVKYAVLSKLRTETIRVRKVCTEFLCVTIVASGLLILLSVSLFRANRRYEKESARFFETSNKLALLVDTSFDAIFFCDKDLVIRSWNPACCRLFGYSAEEATGKSLELITPAQLMHELTLYRNTASRGLPIEPYETKRINKLGKEITVSVSVSPIFTSSDSLDGITIVMRDVSERCQLQQQKDDLVAALAHDLKNPLISSNLLLEIIREDLTALEPETIRDMTGRIASANTRMIETVNEMLDVYRLESGAINIDPKPVDVTRLCVELQAEMSPAFERKKINFTHEIDANLSAVTDPKVLRRILYNLLDNALKHCDEGVNVNFIVKQFEDHLVLTVSDNGPGLSPSERIRAFQRIFRVPGGNQNEGSGLGLYAARLLSDLIGAKLEYLSSKSASTIFKLELY
jgi:PAS domain S-box-containing protein